jgi:TRAP-type mannitol/chloroaromatic compound transport system permease small subunit
MLGCWLCDVPEGATDVSWDWVSWLVLGVVVFGVWGVVCRRWFD